MNAKIRSRGGTTPLRLKSRATATLIATMSFMSMAPRPQTKPSWIAPENGSTVHSAAFAGTTSTCPCTISAPRSRSAPGSRQITFPRPGTDST